MTGADLQAVRYAAALSGYDLARGMAVSRQRIFLLEQQPAPEPTTVARYLRAVADLVEHRWLLERASEGGRARRDPAPEKEDPDAR